MKGLLLKDLYMTRKYCWMMLAFIALFTAVSFVDKENLFFQFYPVVITSILPVTILGYDEKCHWDVYGQVFPYSKKQLVSVKYLLGLILVCAMWLLLVAIQFFGSMVNQTGGQGDWWSFLLVVLSTGLLASGLMLPIIFKFGTEKGRLAFMVVIVLICAGSTGAMSLSSDISFRLSVSTSVFSLAALAASSIIFFLSWVVSVKIYERKEF
ncbi:ABC-2 transporter permease [bacterium D16-51]|nr:ABC-2 transporter permease [bacterium D16-59]RKI57713.1 ABC-2 transporter permease [bacterium D16-51]